MKKIMIGAVIAFAVAIGLAATAQATPEEDRQFVAALKSAGWTITNVQGVTDEGGMVCDEGLAHGVSVQEMHTTLTGKGYSSLDASTLIRTAVQVYCPERSNALVGLGGGSNGASPVADGEWWDTPAQGQTMCSLVKGYGRDWTVSNLIGDYSGTAEGARHVDVLIAKYCPQYAD